MTGYKYIFLLLMIIALIIPVFALESDVIGVFWDGSSSSPTLTRINWNNNTISPDYNTTFPWREMARDNSSYAWLQNQTMVKIPAFYYYIDRPADNITKFYIYANTTYNLSGMPPEFELHPAFYVNTYPV